MLQFALNCFISFAVTDYCGCLGKGHLAGKNILKRYSWARLKVNLGNPHELVTDRLKLCDMLTKKSLLNILLLCREDIGTVFEASCVQFSLRCVCKLVCLVRHTVHQLGKASELLMLIIGNAVGDPLYIADFSEDSMEFLDNTHGTLLRA